MQENKPIIVFFGTSHFAVPVLKALANSPYKPDLVVTQPDALVGRKKILMPPPVKQEAVISGIEIIQPETLKTIEIAQKLETLKPDLFILAAYGRIIPRNILDIPRLGNLNVHPSLLPQFRGPSPIHAAILSGAAETGATIIQMDEEIDHGPIVAQEKFSLPGSETYEQLQKKLSDFSSALLLNILPDYFSGQVKPAEQDHSKAVFCKLIKSEDARIDWTKQALEIERMVRAYYIWPKAHAFWRKTPEAPALRINILKAKIAVAEKKFEAGRVISYGQSFAVAAGGGLIIPEQIQLAGKKEMEAEAFLRGHKEIVGALLS